MGLSGFRFYHWSTQPAAKVTSHKNNCPKIEAPIELLLGASPWDPLETNVTFSTICLVVHGCRAAISLLCPNPTLISRGKSQNKPLLPFDAWVNKFPDTCQVLSEHMCPHSSARNTTCLKPLGGPECSQDSVFRQNIGIVPSAGHRMPSWPSHSWEVLFYVLVSRIFYRGSGKTLFMKSP